MKTLKIYIITATVMLAIALGCGIYVWYLLQKIGHDSRNQIEEPEKPSIAEDLAEPITIHTQKLPEVQQKALEPFTNASGTLSITPEMVRCAEAALGETALGEIKAGRAPSPLESLRLLACIKG